MEGRDETGSLLALAERAEALGFDSVWVGDSVLARPRHDPLTLLAAVAARTRRVELGTAVLLRAIRPNPGETSVEIDYQLLEHGETTLTIYDVHGRRIARPLDEYASPGPRLLRLDVTTLPDGMYLCVLRTPTEVISRTLYVRR